LADVELRGDALAHDATLLTETVREAGLLAKSMFSTELKNWIKGKSSPVSEADIAVNDLLEMFKSMVAANDLKFRYGVNAPTVRIEGLTLGGR